MESSASSDQTVNSKLTRARAIDGEPPRVDQRLRCLYFKIHNSATTFSRFQRQVVPVSTDDSECSHHSIHPGLRWRSQFPIDVMEGMSQTLNRDVCTNGQ